MGDLDGNFFCLNIENGDVIWKKFFEISFIILVNEFNNDIIVIGEIGFMVRIDLVIGDMWWEMIIEDWIFFLLLIGGI